MKGSKTCTMEKTEKTPKMVGRIPPEPLKYGGNKAVKYHHDPKVNEFMVAMFDKVPVPKPRPSIVFSWNMPNLAEFIAKVDALGDKAPPPPPLLEEIAMFPRLDPSLRSLTLKAGILQEVSEYAHVDVIGGYGGTVGLIGAEGPLLEAGFVFASLRLQHPWFRAVSAVSPGGGPLATLHWANGTPGAASEPLHFGFPTMWGH
jgi:hypothetical protein